MLKASDVDPPEVREFRAACLRAFAGTRWKPVKVVTYTQLERTRYLLTITLHMDDLRGTIPYDEFVPRPAAVRDPRFLFRRRRR